MPRTAFFVLLLALPALLLISALHRSTPVPASAEHDGTGAHVDQISIDAGPPGTDMGVESNGRAAALDRNGDGLPDAEGTLEGVCPFDTTTDTQDDDGDTVVNDGCPGGPAADGTPEMGVCGNGVDDDPYKPIVGAVIFDGVADDGCVIDLSAPNVCVEIIDDGILNADEDLDVDLASIDVTVGAQPGPGGGVPASRLLTAWQFDLAWSVDVLDVQFGDTAFLIHAAGTGTPFINIPDSTPADSPYVHAVADGGPHQESGAGVLARYIVEGNAAGLAVLTLNSASLRDTANALIPIDVVNAAGVAVSSDTDGDTVISGPAEVFTCADFTPPTPTPTPTPPPPTPTPTPGSNLLFDDARIKRIAVPHSVRLAPGVADTSGPVTLVVNQGSNHPNNIGIYLALLPPLGSSNFAGCSPTGVVNLGSANLTPGESVTIKLDPAWQCADPGAVDGVSWTLKAIADVNADDFASCATLLQVFSGVCSAALADDDDDDTNNTRLRARPIVDFRP